MRNIKHIIYNKNIKCFLILNNIVMHVNIKFVALFFLLLSFNQCISKSLKCPSNIIDTNVNFIILKDSSVIFPENIVPSNKEITTTDNNNFIQEVFSIQEVLAFKYTKGYFVKLKTLFNAQFMKAMYVGKINLFFKPTTKSEVYYIQFGNKNISKYNFFNLQSYFPDNSEYRNRLKTLKILKNASDVYRVIEEYNSTFKSNN